METTEQTSVPLDETEAQSVGCVERTFHLTIAYDGTNYAGWQIQPNARTVQGELRHRLRLMLRNPELLIAGCSRTDSGVHALDQQVSFTVMVPEDCTPQFLMRKLNRWLPEDIVVLSAREAKAGFNARFANHGKAYTYCISPGRKFNPLLTRFVWKTPHELDIAAMRKAASYLEGEHDFKSFTVNCGRELESTVRVLHRLELVEQDGLIYVIAVGESFLYKMVRSLAGYLVHVGNGYCSPEQTPDILASRNRCKAADSAPARGLFLARVFWTPDEWQTYTPILPPFGISALHQ